ncbi:MAG: hypothetical protein KIG95_13910 [Comamonas sp.]|nr:hypothetical protein [Comamonas sp.]
MIADKQTSLETALNNAVKKAEAGTVALLDAVEAEIAATNAAIDAKATADAAMTDAGTVFGALNAGLTYSATADHSAGKVSVDDGKLYQGVDGTAANSIVLANNINGAWVLTDAGKPATTKGVADLLAAFDVQASAATAETNAKEALVEAVEAVYLNENGGYSVKALGGGTITYGTTAGKSDITIDYSVTADIYETKANADIGAGSVGKQQEFTFKVTDAGKIGDKFEFDGLSYDVTGLEANVDAVATAIAGAMTGAGSSTTTWAASASGDTVTIKASVAAAEVKNLELKVTKGDAGTVAASKTSFTDGDDSSSAAAFVFKIDAAVKKGDKITVGDKEFIFDADYDVNTAAAWLKTQIDNDGNGTAIKLAGASGTPLTFNAAVTTDSITLTATATTALSIDVNAVVLTPDPRDAGTLAGTSDNPETGEASVSPAPTVSEDAGLSKAVADAQTSVDTFEKLVADFLTARELNGELDARGEAITEATAWFEENDYSAPKQLENGKTGNGSADDDIFLLSDLKGKDTTTVNKFGDKGLDYLFVGEGYELVDLGAKAIADKVGSDAALEIFYKQNGANLELYVEQETYAGSLTTDGGLTEIVKVTLLGVSIDDITLDGSFITAGV